MAVYMSQYCPVKTGFFGHKQLFSKWTRIHAKLRLIKYIKWNSQMSAATKRPKMA